MQPLASSLAPIARTHWVRKLVNAQYFLMASDVESASTGAAQYSQQSPGSCILPCIRENVHRVRELRYEDVLGK